MIDKAKDCLGVVSELNRLNTWRFIVVLLSVLMGLFIWKAPEILTVVLSA
jgi:hypothetical protein